MKLEFQSPFKFVILEYHISHNKLLIRSWHEGSESRNIDLFFKGVLYLEVPTELNGIFLFEGEEKDLDYIKSKMSLNKYQGSIKPFIINSKGKKYYIAAVSCVISENDKKPLISGFHS